MNADDGNQLSNSLSELATALQRGFESVRAVTAGEVNRFSRALQALRELAHSEQIPLAIIGDLGTIRYGYHIAAQYIDIVVAQDHLARLVKSAPRYGFSIAHEVPIGWHTLTYGDLATNVVPAGDMMHATAPTTIPAPEQLGVHQGLDYASLPSWIELKLSSARQIDLAHFVEVMKKASPESHLEARIHIASVHPSYLLLFDQLFEEAEQERKQEEQRGH